VLESEVRIAVAEVELDPSIDRLQVCHLARDSFIYGLMEPYQS
jgi:hypothetical protein